MRVLIVKMSSLGDVIHTLPAVTDALDQLPGTRFDWVVEEAFRDIPAMHPAVERVISVAIRRWRGNWSGALREIRPSLMALREQQYDRVIDAQGLIKSALVTRLSRGPSVGFDRASAREPLASLAYDTCLAVPKGQHAVERVRQLFAGALDYPVPAGVPRYGLLPAEVYGDEAKNVILLHGTTWPSKQWPIHCWQALGDLIEADGYRVMLPFGNDEEARRAEVIADALQSASILPRPDLARLAGIIGTSAGVVSVDTGLGHLATALGTPVVALYGPTDPALTGMHGERQTVFVGGHLPCIPCMKRTCKYRMPDDSSKIYPPCFETMTPVKVWDALKFHMDTSNRNQH